MAVDERKVRAYRRPGTPLFFIEIAGPDSVRVDIFAGRVDVSNHYGVSTKVNLADSVGYTFPADEVDENQGSFFDIDLMQRGLSITDDFYQHRQLAIGIIQKRQRMKIVPKPEIKNFGHYMYRAVELTKRHAALATA